MFGKIFLVLYVIVQILISVLTEYSIKNSKVFGPNIGEGIGKEYSERGVVSETVYLAGRPGSD